MVKQLTLHSEPHEPPLVVCVWLAQLAPSQSVRLCSYKLTNTLLSVTERASIGSEGSVWLSDFGSLTPMYDGLLPAGCTGCATQLSHAP